MTGKVLPFTGTPPETLTVHAWSVDGSQGLTICRQDLGPMSPADLGRALSDQTERLALDGYVIEDIELRGESDLGAIIISVSRRYE